MSDNLKSSNLIKDSESLTGSFHIVDLSADDLAHKGVSLARTLGTEEYKDTEKNLANSGWEVLATSVDDKNTNQYGYKAVAFINRNTKEIHISSSSTIITEKYDLIDDARITFGRLPNKMLPVKAFVTKILEQVGGQENVIDYKFSTSGHSLGAIVSDLTGIEIHSRGLKFEKSVTFDNPGSKKVVENAIKNKDFSGEVVTSIEELAKHCEVYNAKHNFINTANPQLATKINIVAPPKLDTTIDQSAKSAGIWGWTDYLTSKVGEVVNTCADYLGINKVVHAISNHRLVNFADATSNQNTFEVIDWKKVNGQVMLKPDPKLDKIKSTGNDYVVIKHEKVILDSLTESFTLLTEQGYSYKDLATYHIQQEEANLIGQVIAVC
ncbi:hypothetical protein [Rickettsia bellii]|uniref:Lipase family protein n=1 Tax=Rickettsia bellii str. RML Mogi TaxID=1359194 RepID=A0A0F3QGX1_RICBE|nr:hypothetical protein [Rickettsia bellii]KJV91825.1 lipase family protein [Rickettsia bellii str. RML Mogi]